MGPGPGFEPESRDPQSLRMTSYPIPAIGMRAEACLQWIITFRVPGGLTEPTAFSQHPGVWEDLDGEMCSLGPGNGRGHGFDGLDLDDLISLWRK